VKRTLNSLGWTMAVGLAIAMTAAGAGLVRAQGGSGKVQPLSALDILEIQALGAKYAYGLDTGADEGYYYANVFTVDGTFGNRKGREALAAVAKEGGGRMKLKGYQHIITNYIIEPTPEGAKGSQYLQVLTVGAKGKTMPAVDHGGRYEDVYVKTAEGWRIKARKFVPVWPPE